MLRFISRYTISSMWNFLTFSVIFGVWMLKFWSEHILRSHNYKQKNLTIFRVSWSNELVKMTSIWQNGWISETHVDQAVRLLFWFMIWFPLLRKWSDFEKQNTNQTEETNFSPTTIIIQKQIVQILMGFSLSPQNLLSTDSAPVQGTFIIQSTRWFFRRLHFEKPIWWFLSTPGSISLSVSLTCSWKYLLIIISLFHWWINRC